MSKRSILVTGGAGYIGSHTCMRLSAEGFLPVVYDNLSTGTRRAVRWGPLVEADITDTAAFVAACQRYRPEAVVHFAASAYVGESVVDPGKYYRNNVEGTLSVLRACSEVGVRHLVFSSSCAVYGDVQSAPVDERAPLAPVSPYGRTKLIGEQMLQDFERAYGLRYAALRYFNACGADPDGELGEWHDPETHLVPRALLAAAGRIERLEIYGDDYPTPDGTCVRDYIHVSDLARAHTLALRKLLDGESSLRLNLGAGRGSSILEVLGAIRRVTGRTVPYVVKPRRPGDPTALFADTSLARKVMGFLPELSSLQTIVRTAAPVFGLNGDAYVDAYA
jgi:UDP-arabinose 4-epimerase